MPQALIEISARQVEPAQYVGVGEKVGYVEKHVTWQWQRDGSFDHVFFLFPAGPGETERMKLEEGRKKTTRTSQCRI